MEWLKDLKFIRKWLKEEELATLRKTWKAMEHRIAQLEEENAVLTEALDNTIKDATRLDAENVALKETLDTIENDNWERSEVIDQIND